MGKTRHRALFTLGLLFVAVVQVQTEASDVGRWGLRDGEVSLEFNDGALEALGWQFQARSALGESVVGEPVRLPVHPASRLVLESEDGRARAVRDGDIHLGGTVLLTRTAGARHAIDHLVLFSGVDGTWTLASAWDTPGKPLPVFEISSIIIDPAVAPGALRIVGELAVARQWARFLERPDAAGRIVGTLVLDTGVIEGTDTAYDWRPLDDGTSASDSPTADIRASAAAVGPDVIVSSVYESIDYGSLNGTSAFAIGTVSCNQGDTPASWYANTNQHPVISQNLFRLKDERFEQIGMSWVKHGFAAVLGDSCNLGCIPPPDGNKQLGVGCSDPYSASLNGVQNNMGPRSDVNPHTGAFPYPWSAPAPTDLTSRRIQVDNNDLDPALNVGARYFVEAQYVTPDDALAGNQNNNASYRRVLINEVAPNEYSLQLTGFTHIARPGLLAWEEWVDGVIRRNVEVPDDGQFLVACKPTDLGDGFWAYEYAVQNLNADRAAGSFSIPIEAGASVRAVGFRDIAYHSGEPYDDTDWTAAVDADRITWTTTPYEVDAEANALRWGTMYNFRFEADVSPTDVQATIGLFKPGSPATVQITTLGPVLPPPLCGNGQVETGESCEPPDGVVCDTNCQTIVNDPFRGGLLWDRWWAVTGDPEPTGTHALYPPSGQQTGSDTFRCAECHGWDYEGADGAYATGAHFTGIKGVLDSTLTPLEMFELIKYDTGTNGHGFAALGLLDQDVRDIVQFMLDLAIDTSPLIDASGQFLGDEAQGQVHFETTGTPSCSVCHGADGTNINFGTFEDPEWVGTTAVNDPWRLLHKIRVGSAGSSMPSWIANGGTDEGAADIGLYAQRNLPDTCTLQSHCDDGLFCNGREQCVFGSCTRGSDPCPDQPCDEATETCGTANPLRGGLLWDKWWAVTETDAPTGDHPLYPPTGEQTGSSTYRCKECHGWDYKGVDGAYGSGPHFTGIKGVFGSTLAPADMFNLIFSDTVANGHGFSLYGMTEQDAWDLVQFVQNLAIDTDLFIDGDGVFLGDEIAGETNYNTGGVVACAVCHGPDGTSIDFGSPDAPEWIGTQAVHNPWELFHKIRFGQPGAPMPSWVEGGGTDQSAADIGRYAQSTFPVDCLNDGHCDDGLFCTGEETCVDGLCEPGSDPCPTQACDESIAQCLSGTCATPMARAGGSRYLLVTPLPEESLQPQALYIMPDCAGGVGKYVGEPAPFDVNEDGTADGTVAHLVDDPAAAAFRTPAEWGSTIRHCSVTFEACADDSDCDHGLCNMTGNPCSVAQQDCTLLCSVSGDRCLSEAQCLLPGETCSVQQSCVSNDECVNGGVYVTGPGIAPSDNSGGVNVVSVYEARSNCGSVAVPDWSFASQDTMWLWADVNNDAYVNFADVQLAIRAFQAIFNLSSISAADIVGDQPCDPELVVNFTDVQRIIKAFQGEAYRQIGCSAVCP